MRILIVEDNPPSLELMSYLLRSFGYSVVTAVDGPSGLAAARHERPQLIVCDVHLPGMDGCELVQALKADADLRSVPVLAVTALAMVGDRDRLLSAGFDGYLPKPIDPESFVSTLQQFAGAPNCSQIAVTPHPR